jgi:hypothetical protein
LFVQGIHYRTKRNFASNLNILESVNRALGSVITEMRGNMTFIDDNLERVRRNLEYMEEAYEHVFIKANRLITRYSMGSGYTLNETEE